MRMGQGSRFLQTDDRGAPLVRTPVFGRSYDGGRRTDVISSSVQPPEPVVLPRSAHLGALDDGHFEARAMRTTLTIDDDNAQAEDQLLDSS